MSRGNLQYGLLALAIILAMAMLGGVAQAQDLSLRTVSLVPFAKDKAVEGGLILDLHFVSRASPIKPDDSVLEKITKPVQTFLAENTAASWTQTGNNLGDITKLSEGSPGVSLWLRPKEADVNLGLVWKRDNHNWYGYISFAIK